MFLNNNLCLTLSTSHYYLSSLCRNHLTVRLSKLYRALMGPADNGLSPYLYLLISQLIAAR